MNCRFEAISCTYPSWYFIDPLQTSGSWSTMPKRPPRRRRQQPPRQPAAGPPAPAPPATRKWQRQGQAAPLLLLLLGAPLLQQLVLRRVPPVLLLSLLSLLRLAVLAATAAKRRRGRVRRSWPATSWCTLRTQPAHLDRWVCLDGCGAGLQQAAGRAQEVVRHPPTAIQVDCSTEWQGGWPYLISYLH